MGNNSLVKLMIVHDMKDLVLRLQPPPKKKIPKRTRTPTVYILAYTMRCSQHFVNAFYTDYR